MKYLMLFLACCFTLYSGFSQQKNTAEKLGYPKNAKLLIIHADDLGVAHSVNEASTKAFEKGGITSASIMVPCAWFPEIAAYAKQHPELDWGIHTTFTAEWKNYKWDAVLPAIEVAGSMATDGYLHPSVETFAAHAKPAEVEKELRAQIERAQSFGITLSHIDNHMGSLLFTPSMLPVYFKVAKEFKLAMLAPRLLLQLYPPQVIATVDTSNVVFLDELIMAPDTLKHSNWKAYYDNAINNLKPGLTEIIVHLAYDDAEMKAISIDHPDYGAAWRQRDYEYVTSDAFKKLLKEKEIILVKWKDVQGVMYK
jgi:chitin disaccharide deacetylase